MYAKKLIILVSIIILPILPHAQSTIAVGGWKTYFNYSAGCDADRIDNNLFYASKSSIIRIDLNDNSMHHLGKVEGLSDVGIQCLRANQNTKTVVICYSNSNIDLYQNGSITNIPDLYNKQISGDKTIYSIFTNDKYAYLACGFGVVVLDLKKKIVADSWFFRQNNQNYPVKDLAITKDGTIYAATDHALLKNNIGNSNIKNFATWEQVNNIITPNNDYFKQLAILNDHLYLMKIDTQTIIVDTVNVYQSENTIYSYNGNLWEKDTSFSFKEYESDYQYAFIRSSFEKLMVGTNAGVKSYFIDTSSNNIYTENYYRSWDPLTAVCGMNNTLYVITPKDGLFQGKSGEIHYYDMPGPAPGAVAAMNWKKSKLVTAHNSTKEWMPYWNQGYVSSLQNNTWSVISAHTNDDNIYDIIGVSIAPYDNSIVFATSFLQGLLEYKDNSLVTLFNNSNSSLDIMNGGTVRTTSPVFDQNNNLWMGNWGAMNALAVHMTNGSWKSFSIPFGGMQYVEKVFVDSRNTLWLICERESKLVLFNHNSTPTNTSDDQWANLNLALPEEKGSFNLVHSIAEDKEGKIWIGTDKGIKVYYSPSQLLANPNLLPEPIYITKDSLNELLLNFEAIRCIKVDAGNRKWLGTENSGVFLLSSDGKQEIFHFTTENSPLLSNTILDIEINGETGEVYFGTEKGLISFRYTATDGKENYDDLKIFPNPVRENFNGYITISGLKEDSEVKITDAQGGIVYRTLSNGGTASWNGIRFDGRKASTGVYFVFINDETGKERKAGKILFIK